MRSASRARAAVKGHHNVQQPSARTAEELDAQIERFLYRFRRVGAFNIKRFAESFCEHLGLHEFPRNPVVYLPTFGIHLQPAALNGVRAVWLRAGGVYLIQYSRFLSGQLGIVLWHEFFEMMSAHPRFPTRLPPELEERLATLFAVHVMMPEDEVRAQAAELRHPELDKSRVLAARFGVSWTAMRVRLRELGLVRRQGLARERYM